MQLQNTMYNWDVSTLNFESNDFSNFDVFLFVICYEK